MSSKKTGVKKRRAKITRASEAERAEAIRILEKAEDCARKLTEALNWQAEGVAYLRKHRIQSAEAAILAISLGIEIKRRLTAN